MKKTEKFHLGQIKDTEQVIRIIHRHWFDILQQFLIVFLIILLLAGGLFVFPAMFPSFQDEDFSVLFFFMESLLAIFVWIFSFLIFIDYYFDVWIITSERIINIEQKGLFVRHVSELKFSKIQDVTTEVEGLIPTILNYGDVHIQTAAEEAKFIFRHVGDPYKIKETIMQLQKHQEAERDSELSEMLKK